MAAERQNRAICKFNLKIARFSRRPLSRHAAAGAMAAQFFQGLLRRELGKI